MADWEGRARSNYVKVDDIDGLRAEMDFWGVKVQEDDGKYCLLCYTDDGGWPTVVRDDDDDTEEEFDFAEHVMPFVAEGEVFVAMEVGHELMRYVTGWAGAYVRAGNDVRSVSLNLGNIYGMARREFGIEGEVSRVEY